MKQMEPSGGYQGNFPGPYLIQYPGQYHGIYPGKFDPNFGNPRPSIQPPPLYGPPVYDDSTTNIAKSGNEVNLGSSKSGFMEDLYSHKLSLILFGAVTIIFIVGAIAGAIYFIKKCITRRTENLYKFPSKSRYTEKPL